MRLDDFKNEIEDATDQVPEEYPVMISVDGLVLDIESIEPTADGLLIHVDMYESFKKERGQ